MSSIAKNANRIVSAQPKADATHASMGTRCTKENVSSALKPAESTAPVLVVVHDKQEPFSPALIAPWSQENTPSFFQEGAS